MTDIHSLARHLAVPVIASPLFIISTPDLVIAQCKAGVIGSFPALNARPPDLLDEWLHRIEEELAAHDRRHPERPAAPFAVNQIVHRSNPRWERDMEICAKRRVKLIITSLGAREDVNASVRAYGGITLHDITDNRFAHKAIDKGADGLIAVASGAGGHSGSLSPFALVQEIRAWWEGPLALSGAIANGRAILATRALGADFAYIGTPFIATTEANAEAAYKQMIVDGSADDIVLSDVFTGIPGNYLRPSLIRAGLDPNLLANQKATMLDLSSDAKAWKDIWGAGQGIGAVHAVRPTAECVRDWAREYNQARAALAA